MEERASLRRAAEDFQRRALEDRAQAEEKAAQEVICTTATISTRVPEDVSREGV